MNRTLVGSVASQLPQQPTTRQAPVSESAHTAQPPSKTGHSSTTQQRARDGEIARAQTAPALTDPDVALGYQMSDVDAFVRLHRQQIRDITDCCKEETTLLSKLTTSGILNHSMGVSETTAAAALRLDVSANGAFLEYVFALDGLLERKFRAMTDLRQSVKTLLREGTSSGEQTDSGTRR